MTVIRGVQCSVTLFFGQARREHVIVATTKFGTDLCQLKWTLPQHLDVSIVDVYVSSDDHDDVRQTVQQIFGTI